MDDGLSRMEDTAAGRAQLLQALRVLRRDWPIIVLLIACLAGAAVAKSLNEPSRYRASVLLLYNPDQANTAFQTDRGVSGAPATDAQTAAVGRATLQRLATGRRIRRIVEARLGRVSEHVSASVDQDSNVMTLSVEGQGRTRVAEVGNAWAAAFVDARASDKKASYAEAIDLVERLRRDQDATSDATDASLRRQEQTLQILAALQQSDVRLIQPAVAPRSAFAPTPVRDGIVGGVAGLLLAMLVLVVRQTLDRRIKTLEDAESAWGAPLLASIGRITQREARTSTAPGLRDSFDHLQASLSLSRIGREPKLVAVTSAVAAEGKSTAALGLAVSLARNGRRVLLVDADFRRPSLSSHFETRASPDGLSTVLSGRRPLAPLEVPVESVSTAAGHEERALHFVGTGPLPPNPYEFFSDSAMSDFVASLREDWDCVILDCAPLLPVSDSVPIVSAVDGVLIAVRLYHSRSDMSRRARQLIDRTGARVLGLVVAVPNNEMRVYGYGYGARTRSKRSKRRVAPLSEARVEV